MFRYDIVICSDINRNAFTQEQLDWTVELVYLRGGGFAMIGGDTSFGAGKWDQTVWDELIPVKMSGDRPSSFGQGYTYGQFRVVVPNEVERHPIWRIAEDPRQNAAILSRMPPFYGTNFIDREKPGATVLGQSDRQIIGSRQNAGLRLPVVRQRADLRHDHRHHLRLGPGFRIAMGRRGRQPILSQVLAERRQMAGRKFDRRKPAAASRNR